MERMFILIILMIISVLFPVKGYAVTDSGCRIWENYREAYEKFGKSSELPDFSFAGYHNGAKDIPDVTCKIFNVCDYGAIPDDNKSDREAVELAIKAAELHGEGIVFFPKGRYNLHESGDSDTPIVICGGNIVFRGEGAESGGTEIYMHNPLPAYNPAEKWTSPNLFSFTGRKFSRKLSDVSGDSPKGSFSVKVKDTSCLEPGDWICLRLSDNSKETICRELNPYEVEDTWSSILLYGVQVYDYHKIVKIDGDEVFFAEPLMREVLAREKWTIFSFPHISEVGIENMAFVGNWKEKFVHHKDWLHDGGWKLIEFKNVVDSWVRGCRFTNVSEAVTVTTSANVSVYDCTVEGNTGHNSMHAMGASRTFFGAISDEPAQWHSVGVAKHSIGTVIWRVHTNSNSSFESHASQPRATLFDACDGGFLIGRAGGAYQNNPNHLADMVFWNYRNTSDRGSDKIIDLWDKNSRYMRFMPPIIVGFHGNNVEFDPAQVLYMESKGNPVRPESLYEAQLELRLGMLPSWLVGLKKKVSESRISGHVQKGRRFVAGDPDSIMKISESLGAGDTLVMKNGVYGDTRLLVGKSGTFRQPIVIMAETPGAVIFRGGSSAVLYGDHIKLSGVVYEKIIHGNDASEKGVISILGSHCNITDCLFKASPRQTVPWIVFGSYEGSIPQCANIGYCSFLGRSHGKEISFVPDGRIYEPNHAFPGPRIHNCHFKSGLFADNFNTERCQIDNNIFEYLHRNLSISGRENLLFNNTFLNCSGDIEVTGEMNFMINNFFLSTDQTSDCGHISVSGMKNVFASNYISLTKRMNDGWGVLALGNDDSSTLGNVILNNHFINIYGPVFSFGRNTSDNYFYRNKLFTEELGNAWTAGDTMQRQEWSYNVYFGYADRPVPDCIECPEATLRYDDSKIYIEDINLKVCDDEMDIMMPCRYIPGIDIDLFDIVRYGPSGSPSSINLVGPRW